MKKEATTKEKKSRTKTKQKINRLPCQLPAARLLFFFCFFSSLGSGNTEFRPTFFRSNCPYKSWPKIG
jgi:hypothetical protein